LTPLIPTAKPKNLAVENQLWTTLLRVDIYSRRYGHQANTVLDVRDGEAGLDRRDLLDVFEARAHFASNASYEYAPYTLIASRCSESSEVAFTVIQRMNTDKDRYLCLKDCGGGFPTLSIPEERFPIGTLVRHFGYDAPFHNAFQENSVQGALDRILPGMSFPVATFYHDLGGEE